MQIVELLEAERDTYVSAYLDLLDEVREQHPTASTEVLIRPKAPEFSELLGVCRLDIVHPDEGGSVHREVLKEDYYDFPETEIATDSGLKVSLSRFHWNHVEFRCEGALENTEALVAWAIRWLKPEVPQASPSEELGGVIHSVTEPKVDAEGSCFTVDFGSAEVDALFELLEVLVRLGVQRLRMGSFGFFEEPAASD